MFRFKFKILHLLDLSIVIFLRLIFLTFKINYEKIYQISLNIVIKIKYSLFLSKVFIFVIII